MDTNDTEIENLLDGLDETGDVAMLENDGTAPVAAAPRRSLPQMMRRIPVTLTLEVGSARVSLQELIDIRPASLVELDTLAGEPLVIKVNGTPIGHAEVVLMGENHGLRVIDLDGLDLDSLTQ
ncbi:MAG: FliM/FliN family flagellar motor switch protein [Gammaproteobacteria bacterium]|jgi:flagellar motor switch protein FliN|nr:FliM/FliN family flagellar motor switch protein [Gammaproteobacteria bacterium]MBU0771186.1 FliM/FliN family flagellar motor switch protein [Gammaproteobacteria bacterium]MBU0855914.1 FliM/FliN family flagellar motor switch protein [Gammaproteobacteria bacterium]MBU1849001.1 FliM/FliN family flagellar motor switch protein [Gammaproteobacteria bacterium]